MTQKERYDTRRAAGLCAQCGKPAVQGNALCQECKDKKSAYESQTRQWRKNNGLCTHCGTRKADKGYTTCLICRMDFREERKRYPKSDTQKQKQNECGKKLYDARKAEGKCTRCGKFLPDRWDKTLCPMCRVKRNRRERERTHDAGIKTPIELRGNGLYCAICLKPVEQQGKKLCDRCYKNCCERIAKGRKNVPKDNLFARKIRVQWRDSRFNAEKYNKKGV